MDLNKAKIILEKINTLYRNISIDDNVSAIERDLMLAYIRQLYEEFLEESAAPTKTSKTTRKTRKQTPPPPVVELEPEPVYVPEEIEEPEPEPAPVVKKPRIVEIPDSIKDYATPPATATKPKRKAAPVVTPPPAPEPEPVAEVSAEPKEHDVLFEQKQAKELSDKLSELPIKDLTKAMGINEKILTINELFGGDHKAFDSAMKDLNALSTFKEAKGYMSENLADKYGWSDKGKKKKAQIFIKLVRRRY